MKSNNEDVMSVVKDIKKRFGEESIMIMGQETIKKVDFISSGSLLLDQALGIGGFPVGRIVEVYGPESSGKTTLALHAITEAQKLGKTAAFIDAENAIDLNYAANLGVDVSNLLLSQPDSGEQALEICDTLVRSNSVDIIIVDSVAALVPQVELDGEMSDQTIGVQARLMSKGLRKMAGAINQSNVIVIFINQLREKIGVMFGSPETTSGGRALRFYCSVRIDIRKCDIIKNNGDVIGIKSRIKVVKNKVAPPFKVVEVDIYYGKGISKLSELVELAVEFEIISKSGSWYSYGDIKIGQGKEVVKAFLLDNKEVHDEVFQKMLKLLQSD